MTMETVTLATMAVERAEGWKRIPEVEGPGRQARLPVCDGRHGTYALCSSLVSAILLVCFETRPERRVNSAVNDKSFIIFINIFFHLTPVRFM